MTEAISSVKPVTDLQSALVALDRLAVNRILHDYAAGREPFQAVEEVVIPALQFMGERFETGELSLSQIYMSGRICEEAVDQMLPRGQGTDSGRARQPRMALAVLEDNHALGKKIVQLTLRVAGYSVMDYGVGLSVDELVRRTLKDETRILLISALTLPAALKIAAVRQQLDESGPRAAGIRILVGGAPFRFDPDLWRELGVDGAAVNASQVIAAVHQIVTEMTA